MQRAEAPAGAVRHLALRLSPGAELRSALCEAFDESGAAAGFVAACVGSLTVAPLRFANRDDAVEVPGPLEIVALSGTLSPDGPHLHLTVADAEGHVTGGHLMPGALVRTTAEVVLGLTDAFAFSRAQDPATGYAELFIRAR